MLSRISESEGLNQKELAARADKDQPTTTRILDLLEKKGLIRRELSPNDRRAFLLRMTDAGHALLASTSTIEKECDRLITEGIDPQNMKIFWDIIYRMNANIEQN